MGAIQELSEERERVLGREGGHHTESGVTGAGSRG
ncbi:MAG: hypothetical protein AVDCRST_MAG05-630 [uncultured Rubrobacteraceae bacterium]|uniref:Uncharacterized protein n=1 Tax=uncultured Rubrobacteraceae bacterium TaxID=349277 RepID=A0A6J4REX8_9ACTN|nr:MAG: hypothetical protein AVDCRST_MAG05-630 [uncultured Rubrobacteraceae bacterium]